eukprot:15352232-Ditylum_brightwellii.AAC.1
MNHVVIICSNTSTSQYGEAVQHMALQEYKVNAVINELAGISIEYKNLIKSEKHRMTWEQSCANEFGRLAQGVGDRIQGTNTMLFIPRHKVPGDKTATYAWCACDIRPQKVARHRTRITVGGNLIHYPGEVHTPTADIDLEKI